MDNLIDDLTWKMRELEAQMDAHIAQRRAELRVGMERGRVVFEEEVLRRHREQKRRSCPISRRRSSTR
ncbi:MAG: hypothetical protein ACOY5F_12685 [Pseudomonadota bacterium]